MPEVDEELTPVKKKKRDSKSILKAQQREAQKDWRADLQMLRAIRDDPESKPGERLAAIKELKEMRFDKSPTREPEKDDTKQHVIYLGIPTLEMLQRVATEKLKPNDPRTTRRANLVRIQPDR